MGFVIPTGVPASLTAGDYWQFYINLSPFLVSESWTPSMAFEGQSSFSSGDGWTFTGQSGSTWLVQVAATTSVNYSTPGRYHWYCRVTSGTEIYLAVEGYTQLLRGLAAITGDLRTSEEKQLAYAKAAMEARLTGSLEESYSINGRSLQKISTEALQRLIGQLEAKVWRQKNPGQLVRSVGVVFRGPA